MLGNPLGRLDPSGHSPEWLDRLVGAAAQYIDDVSLGMFSALAGDLNEVQNEAFQEGRIAGRAVSTVQASVEIAQGVTTAAAGLAAGPPTLAAAAVCTAGTAGVCAVPGGLVPTAEGAAVIGGTLEAVHGGLMLAKIREDPLGERGGLQDRGTRPDSRMRPLQRGGHTITGRTAEKLGVSRRELGNALEQLKADQGLPHDFHGDIMFDGSYVDPRTGEILGNILDYVH